MNEQFADPFLLMTLHEIDNLSNAALLCSLQKGPKSCHIPSVGRAARTHFQHAFTPSHSIFHNLFPSVKPGIQGLCFVGRYLCVFQNTDINPKPPHLTSSYGL